MICFYVCRLTQFNKPLLLKNHYPIVNRYTVSDTFIYLFFFCYGYVCQTSYMIWLHHHCLISSLLLAGLLLVQALRSQKLALLDSWLNLKKKVLNTNHSSLISLRSLITRKKHKPLWNEYMYVLLFTWSLLKEDCCWSHGKQHKGHGGDLKALSPTNRSLQFCGSPCKYLSLNLFPQIAVLFIFLLQQVTDHDLTMEWSNT